MICSSVLLVKDSGIINLQTGDADASEEEQLSILAIVLLVIGIDVPRRMGAFREFAKVACPLNQQPTKKHLVLAEAETEDQQRLVKYEIDSTCGVLPINAVLRAKQIGVAAV